MPGCGKIDWIRERIFPRLTNVDIMDIHELTDMNANLNTALEFAVVLVNVPD